MDYPNYNIHSVREAVFDEQQLANITIKNAIKDESINSEFEHYVYQFFQTMYTTRSVISFQILKTTKKITTLTTILLFINLTWINING